jgi:hypothetical protein
MLASITPLGERGRRSSWGFTIGAFLIGASAAGAGAGALAGAVGGVALDGGVGTRARLLVLAAALLIAALLDIVPSAVPGPRRQVNELWLDQFRGWVYGLGFGAQLGLGVTTVISSAATYAAIVAAFLTGDPLRGALVLGSFGAIRGLTPLLAARVHRPEQLRALHLRLEHLRAPAGRVALLSLVGMVAVAAAGSVA